MSEHSPLGEGLERFFTLAVEMMCVVSAGRFTRLNEAFAAALGYRPDELLHRGVTELLHPDDVERTTAELARLAPRAAAARFESRIRARNGDYRWLAWAAAADPESGEVYAVTRDVTAARQSHETLRSANLFLDAVFENIPNMVFVKDAERLCFVRLNRAGEELLGMTSADLFGKNDHDFFPKDEADFFQAKDRQTLAGKAVVEIAEEPIQTRQGLRLLRTKKVPILREDGTPSHLLGISEDITERKAGLEARARLAAIVDDSEDAIIARDLDGKVTSWNRGAESMFGYSADEMLGRTIEVLVPEHRMEQEAEIRTLIRGGERVPPYTTTKIRKDGRAIDVSVATSPIRDASARIIGVSFIARDISEMKRIQRELQRAKDATDAVNRELESFSYSIAHDLRTPVRSIDGFSKTLIETCGAKLDDSSHKYLGFIYESAQHLTQVIDAMLTLSRITRSELHRVSVDISALARAAVQRVQRSDSKRQVDVSIQDGLTAEGDPQLLGVVLDNLIGNAWKFTANRPRARIEVGLVEDGDAPTFFVRDNGVGFDMRNATALFGVFQRLHSAREFDGSGIGLATVQRIIHRHGGRVWAEGRIGEGATFYFTLSG